MVVAVDASWKLAIAYFFIAHLGSDDKSQLVRVALQKLHDIKIQAVGVTCDCPTTNWAALKQLGASFCAEDLKSWFPHPCDAAEKVQVIFDPCHLVKLVRNVLSDFGTIYDGNGHPIRYF